jgi:tetratricopeptide (TPR) repeat protein
MAGYNAQAVVAEDEKVNFFAEWIRALGPIAAPQDPDHPTPEQRAAAVRAHLRQVLENVELFHLGVLFYQCGQYDRAILAFQKFLTYFPSREVYHDLAASHHQLALKYYRRWKGEEKGIPFKMSLALDLSTRASAISLRTGQEDEALFRKHLKTAIELYETALSHDPSYILSCNNLACALLLKGEEGDAYKAIGRLQDAAKIEANAQVLNNLGVAYYYAESPTKAKKYLLQAYQLDPAYDAPLFNLGRLAREMGQERECQEYWSAYLKLDPDSAWAQAICQALGFQPAQPTPLANKSTRERILGLEVGSYEDEVPPDWAKSERKEIALEEQPFCLSAFRNHVKTLSQRQKIQMILTQAGFAGKAERGIALGTTAREVRKVYGAPSRILDLTQGQTWVYDLEGQGIAFQLEEDRVVSWVIFDIPLEG